MKYYALYWCNGDNFDGVIIDETGEKTESQILQEIGKGGENKYGEVPYFLSEIEPIFV